mmetsp:Transcript_58581/g.66795  ORF Transcript_58581/g.66795 Transcript_58581/m.66795 type:complete len:154 (+) Transcript_58581:34-495(+)
MVRFKNRYIVVELRTRDANSSLFSLTSQHFRNSIRDAIDDNFGLLGAAKCHQSLNIKFWDPLTKLAIIRIARDHAQILQQTLLFISSINNQEVQFNTIYVGATIKHCEMNCREFINRWLSHTTKNAVNKQVILDYQQKAQGVEEKLGEAMQTM